MFAAGVGYRDKNTRGSESDALEAVKVVIAAGLDIKQTNSRGETALHGAAVRGADTIVQFLVDQGAEAQREEQAGIHAARRRDGQDQRGPAARSQATHRGAAPKARRPRRQGREVGRMV